MVKLLLTYLFLGTGLCCAQSLTPPEPVLPTQGDTLSILYPTFSWQPAYPPQGVVYELRLYEVIAPQTPQAAVLANPVLYASLAQVFNSHIYPLNAPALQNGRHYAWQITVMPQREGAQASFSPVSHFYIHQDTFSTPLPDTLTSYIEPTPQEDQRRFVISTEWLPVVIDTKYSPSRITFELYNEAGSQVSIPNVDAQVSTKYGDNYVQFYLGSLPAGTYLAKITSRKKEAVYVRFIVAE